MTTSLAIEPPATGLSQPGERVVGSGRWSLRPNARWLGACIVVLLAFFTLSASAQPMPLFVPLSARDAADANPTRDAVVSKIRARPTTGVLTLGRLNVGALDAAGLSIALPDNRQASVNRSASDRIAPNATAWSGNVSGAAGQATLIVKDGNVTGTLRIDGDLYRVEPVGDGVHALFKVDEGRFPPEHPPSFQQIEKRPLPPAAPASNRSDAKPADGPVGLDVLVAYTSSASGAVTDIATTIQLAVAEANQSYVNSGINIKLNLVDTMAVTYAEAGKSFDTILADFVAMQPVRDRRDSSGADLVTMIINQTDYCGLADAIQATADTAYAIVHYDCATGYYSFAYELGHLMGARHDPATDSTTTPFAYGHGFQYVTPTTKWRTVMAYNCAGGCTRIQYWSNPNVSYGGVAMGTAAVNDNARVLNGTATTVAAFRTKLGVPFACALFNDGYANMTATTDAIYFRANGSVCKPDGTASGTCRKWFGRCKVPTTGEAVNFSVFNDGYTNITAPVDAADVLAGTARALAEADMADRFTGRGPWKKRLPQILQTLEALGRARREGERWRA